MKLNEIFLIRAMTDASGSLGVNIGGNERAGTSKGDLLNELIE